MNELYLMFKILMFLVFSAYGATIFLWPVCELKVSLTQKLLFGLYQVVLFTLMFAPFKF